MKLVRFGEPGEERPGVWIEESGKAMILDVRASAFDIEDYSGHFFSFYGLERLEALLRERGRKLIHAKGVRIGPPIARPGKIVCLGANYAEHAKEFGAQVPTSPILFSKATTAIVGPHDPVVLPFRCGVVDGECELAVVIGRPASKVSAVDALEYVAGYTILNDITDRDAQKSGIQWFRGKSGDTFCPLGPWLVSRDEIANPQDLNLKLTLNGRVLQDDSSANMIFKIPDIIAFISASITLMPGDVIATGTPSGIGSRRNPPVVCQPGDTMEAVIEGLGRQCNKIILAGAKNK